MYFRHFVVGPKCLQSLSANYTCRLKDKRPTNAKAKLFCKKVTKGAKTRNRYNQVPHLTQDINGKVKNAQLDTTNESQEVSPFPRSLKVQFRYECSHTGSGFYCPLLLLFLLLFFVCYCCCCFFVVFCFLLLFFFRRKARDIAFDFSYLRSAIRLSFTC